MPISTLIQAERNVLTRDIRAARLTRMLTLVNPLRAYDVTLHVVGLGASSIHAAVILRFYVSTA